MQREDFDVVIVGAGLCITMVMYGVIEVFGIMFKPLAMECRWDRGTVSAAAFVNWIAFGASSLACGALSDRFGSQRVMLGGAVIFVAGTVLMSQVEQLWQLYLFFGVMLAVGRAAAGVPLTVLVTRWFTRNQGLALSLSQSQNVGSVIFAPLAVMLIANYGWRGAYMWLGAGALVIIPLALLMRDAKPVPKKVYASPEAEAEAERRAGPQLTLREAMRHRVFWTLNFATMCCCITHSDILLHGANFMHRFVHLRGNIRDTVLVVARQSPHPTPHQQDGHQRRRYTQQNEQRQLGTGQHQQQHRTCHHQQVAQEHRKTKANDLLQLG